MPSKLTPFQRPSQLQVETPIGNRVIFQIGPDRFAIDFTITELHQKPAEVVPIHKKRQGNKRPRFGSDLQHHRRNNLPGCP